jgi:L-amino acid N-acyltransferase YncA
MLASEYIQDYGIERNNRIAIAGSSGTSVTVRAINQSDLVLVQEMHERLSRDSIYYRYLGPHKPTAENLAQLCSSNGETGTVLVATVEGTQEQVIAIACYQKDPEDLSTAEPAILVEDSCQGRGLGKQILLVLCQEAIQNGVETFDTFIDPTNYRVLSLIRGSGLKFESKYWDGLKKVRVWLKPSS